MDSVRRKIIFVDDVNYNLMTIKDRLKKHYEVFPAQSSAILFKILEHVKPDLILLDVNMPGMNGYETIEKLKADDRYADIPVIFLTNQSSQENAVKGISLGAVGYVTKPLTISLLIEHIDHQLNPDKCKNSSQEKEDESKPLILAVDDVPSMLRAIHYALKEKYKVFTLSNPKEVKDFLRKKTPELFLLDYNMPELNGFELVAIIREFPEHQETPIIFLTSDGTIDNLSVAVHLGACDYSKTI